MRIFLPSAWALCDAEAPDQLASHTASPTTSIFHDFTSMKTLFPLGTARRQITTLFFACLVSSEDNLDLVLSSPRLRPPGGVGKLVGQPGLSNPHFRDNANGRILMLLSKGRFASWRKVTDG